MIAGFFYCMTRFCPLLAGVNLAVATSLHGAESAPAAQREITNEHPYLHLIQVPNNGFTLSANLTEVPAGGDVTLAGESSSDGGERWRLAVEGDGADRRLIFELRICADPDIVKAVEENFNEKQFFTTARQVADAKGGLFRVSAPLRLIGNGPHQVTVRLTPPTWEMELFVDGVSLDVEWPLGAMVEAGKPLASHPAVKALDVEAALATDQQIIDRNGGKGAVAKREVEIFGPNNSCPPFFRQRGFNTNAGDPAPMFDGKRWHLYHLKDRDHWDRRWGWGGLSYGHISSEDLVHWVEHPDAVKPGPDEGAVWTGSFSKIGGEYVGFQWNLKLKPAVQKGKTVSGVTIHRSKDGIRFDGPDGAKPLAGIDGGDPDSFEMEGGGYGLLTRGNRDGQRQIFFYTSDDLRNWKEEKSPFAPAPSNSDCPHYFRFQGGHYFFASETARRGEGLYGPWQDIPRSSLGVPKTAPYKDGRRLIVGMVGDGGWGGDNVIHELLKLPDGTLGEKFVPEMTPLRGEVLDLKAMPLIGNSEADKESVTVKSSGDFAAAVMDGVPPLARIRLKVRPSPDCKNFGLAFRGSGNFNTGMALVFNPSEKKAAFGHVTGPGTYRFEPWMGSAHNLKLDQTVSLDVILGPQGLIDVELNGERCVVTRGTKDLSHNRLFLFSEGGNIVFDQIEVRPWESFTTLEKANTK
jgi:hypothetical protein